VFSVDIGGDNDDTDKLDKDENVETDDDLDLKEFFDNLYFSLSAEGGYPDPGENDFVLFFEDLMSTGVVYVFNATADDVDDTDIDDDLDLNLC